MTDQGDKPTGSADTITRVGHRPGPWAFFLAIVALVLLIDLGLKAWCFGGHTWSFTDLPASPVRVQTAEGGGPEVIVPTLEGDGWRVVSRVGPGNEPPRVPQHEPIVLIPKVLNLQLTLNTGAVFGTGQGGRPIFIVVSVLATGIILTLMFRSPAGAWYYQAGLALILGGALGNLYDRVFYSAVRDMLHMLPSTGLWPWIFNPADVSLICGVGLVLLVSWLSERQRAATSVKVSK